MELSVTGAFHGIRPIPHSLPGENGFRGEVFREEGRDISGFERFYPGFPIKIFTIHCLKDKIKKIRCSAEKNDSCYDRWIFVEKKES